MRPEHHRAWVQQAQLDAERGVIACRMCQRHAGLDETTTLWRNGQLVFGALRSLRGEPRRRVLAHGGGRRGARARRRDPLVVGGGAVKLVPRPSAVPPRARRDPPRPAGPHEPPRRLPRLLPALRVQHARARRQRGLDIDEGDAPDDLTFSKAVRCTFCRVLMHVSHGELRLEEDADVRNIRFR